MAKKQQSFGTCLVVKNGIYSGFFDSVLYGKKFDIFLVCNGEVIKLCKHKKSEMFCVKIFGASSDSEYTGGMAAPGECESSRGDKCRNFISIESLDLFLGNSYSLLHELLHVLRF